MSKTRIHSSGRLVAILGGVLFALLAVAGYVQAIGFTAVLQEATPTPATAESTITAPISEEDQKNQQRHISDQQNYLKNLRQEIKDIAREVKQGLDTSTADKQLGEFESCLNSRQREIGTQDFWNNMQECYDHSRTAEDEMKDKLRPMRDCANYSNDAANRRKELKNADQTIKDVKRNKGDATGLEQARANLNSLITKFEQTAASCKGDTASDVADFQRDVGDAFRDWYDLANEVSQKANETRQIEENRKDFEKNLKRQCEKDMAREMKSLDKDFGKLQKTLGTIPQDAQTAYSAAKDVYNTLCTVQIQAMQQALNNGDFESFNDARNEFNNSNRDFWDALNEARNFSNIQQQLKDVTRDMSQREKELARMKKEYERAAKKAGGEVPDVKQILDNYEKVLADAKTGVQTDPQSWWQDYQQQLNEIQNEFWNSQQKVQSIGDVQRWLKDIEREVKFRENDLKNMKKNKGMDPEIISALDGLLSEMKNAVNSAKELLSKDPDSARDTLQGMDDLRMQWDDTMRSFSDRQTMVFELDKVKREVEHAKKRIQELVRAKRITEEEGNSCLDFVNGVSEKLSTIKVEAGIEEFFEGLEDEAREVCPFFDEIGSAPPPDKVYYEEFIRENVKGVSQNLAANVLEKISGEIVDKVLQRLLSDPSTVESLLKAAGTRQDIAADTLEAATSFYDENTQREIIARKAQILELTNKLDQLRLEKLRLRVKIAEAKLNELNALTNDIAQYNFYGEAGNSIRGEVESFIQRAGSEGLSKEQIQDGIEKLKLKKDAAIQESKEAKFEANIIPFFDTDDNAWYTKYVAPLKKQGIVQGKGTDGRIFDPSAQISVGEILTMTFRLSGDSEVGGSPTLCDGKYSNHWAKRFIKWAEDRGLSVVARCTDVNRPALRWEVAQVLLETAANGPVGLTSDSCFKDVKTSDQPVNSVACRALEAGVMKGVNGVANAYNRITRAEAATMVKQAGEKLFGIDFKNGEVPERPIPTTPPVVPPIEEETQSSTTKSATRSRCWWDDGCTDLMSAQLVTPEECKAAGGEGWGPDEDNCKDI